MAIDLVSDLAARLRDVPGLTVLQADDIADTFHHDEALTATPHAPSVVVLPTTTEQVAAVLRLAGELSVPITTRGAGTGLAGGCIPPEGGVLVSTERMDDIVEIDTAKQVAVVQPGVRLQQLDDALAPLHLVYPVYPGENSASIGGNVATNAGGMRAVKYGVTRHHVLGLQAVLASGEVIRTGGKFVKATSGYDLTQLLVGSEGTLAVVTEATIKLSPRPDHQAIALAPFTSMQAVAAAVPAIISSGIGPFLLELLDAPSLRGMARNVGLDLGIPADVERSAVGYLVIGLEDHRADRLEEDVLRLAEAVVELGAVDVYVLPGSAGDQLLDAREKGFWVAKRNGTDDIIDVVVPRACIPQYLAEVDELAERHHTRIGRVGHAGDGNIHLSVLQKDPGVRKAFLREVFAAGAALGGVVSAEHGIGTEKVYAFLEFEDPVKLDLMRAIKRAFDPKGILNPGVLFGD
jgi:glycolate oxidase